MPSVRSQPIAGNMASILRRGAGAPGRIIVSDRSKIIQPLEASIVRKVFVKDGQRVHILFMLRASKIGFIVAWALACQPEGAAPATDTATAIETRENSK